MFHSILTLCKSKDYNHMIINDIIILKRKGWVSGLMRMPYAPYGEFPKSDFSNNFKKIDGK